MGGDSITRVSRMSRKGPLPEGSLSGSAAYGGKCSKNNQQAYGGTCYCGLDLVLLKSNTLDSPRRWFFCCPLYKKPKLRCKYFVWVDEIEADYEDNNNGIVEEGNFNESFAGNNIDGFRQANMNKANMKVLMRMILEMKGNIMRLEIVLFVICLGVGLYIILNLYTLFK